MMFYVFLLLTLQSGGVMSSSANEAELPRAMLAEKSILKADEDKMVCRSSLETGTRFPTKVCKKQSQWKIDERETHEALRGANRQSGMCDIRC